MQKVYTEEDVRRMLTNIIYDIESLSTSWESYEFHDAYKVDKNSVISIPLNLLDKWPICLFELSKLFRQRYNMIKSEIIFLTWFDI